VREAERAADREDRVADLDHVALGEPGGNEIVVAEGHHGDVGRRIGPHPLRPQFAAVVEADDDVVEVRPVDDVNDS